MISRPLIPNLPLLATIEIESDTLWPAPQLWTCLGLPHSGSGNAFNTQPFQARTVATLFQWTFNYFHIYLSKQLHHELLLNLCQHRQTVCCWGAGNAQPVQSRARHLPRRQLATRPRCVRTTSRKATERRSSALKPKCSIAHAFPCVRRKTH